jgi:hypothetical protein
MDRIIQGAGLSGTLLLVLGVMVTAGEAHHGVLTQTYLVTPTRRRVLMAKLGAVTVAGVVLPMVLIGLAVVVGGVQLVARGLPLDLARMAVLEAVLGTIASAALLGILGAAAGALVGNQTPALILVMAWSMVGEGILMTVVGFEAARWLPLHAARAVNHQTPFALPVWTALLVALGYAAALSVSAFKVSLPRDVA